MSAEVAVEARVVHLPLLCDFQDRLSGLTLVNISAGPDGALHVLAVTPPADYRATAGNGVSYARVETEATHDFAVFCLRDGEVTRSDIRGTTWNYHFVQPLPAGELLLACARSRRRSATDFDLNGKVYDQSGRLAREFLLGDGIQQLQTTASGDIWTGYFDEGVYGNFGWDQPVGASGLTRWDRFGNRQYDYQPGADVRRIDDCYALNVVSDSEAWLCYYMDFPLVRLMDDRIQGLWKSPVSGADAFAVWQNHVLFRGGYRHQNTYRLCRLSSGGEMAELGALRFVNEGGEALLTGFVAARGSRLYLLTRDSRCYLADLQMLELERDMNGEVAFGSSLALGHADHSAERRGELDQQ